MPISLANFLNPDSSDPKRDARPPASPSPTAGAPIQSGQRQRIELPELRELRSLLGELSGEWSCVVKAIQDLKKDLAQDPGVVVEAQARRGAGATPAPAATATGAGTAASLPSRPPAAGPEIDAKLGELLKLLRENVARKGSGAPPMEISADVTQQIAREVAGRVKQTVLESLQQQATGPTVPPGSAPAPAPVETGPARPAPAQTKRIPLDDLGALIDQITGQAT